MKRLVSIALIIGMMMSMYTGVIHADADVRVFVSPSGNDSAAGTADAPFLTIDRGLKEIEKLPGSNKELVLREGSYYVEKGIALNSLGSENDQITIKGYEGETARITSARSLPADKLVKVTDNAILSRIPEEARDNIYSIDLKAVGISDYGKLEEKNINGVVSNRTFDFYWNDQPLNLARWPNDDYVKTGNVSVADQKNATCTFAMEEDRINRWKTAKNAYVYGFFDKGWLDSYMPISKIDTDKKEITTKGYCSMLSGKRFYVYNLLEEIDSEREYYLDRDKGILYLYTTDNVEEADFQYVINSSNPIISIMQCNNIKLENLHIGGSTNKAIELGKQSKNIEIRNCQIFNVSDYGIYFGYGSESACDCIIYGCEIRDIGQTAIYATSGDKATLTPGNIIIENNHIYRFGQKIKTYRPAVYLGGVGNKVIHNVMHDAPHEVIHFGGNENEIAYNEIFDALNETDDCGSIYGGRSFTARNYIHNNFFHDYGTYGQAIMAIYCDDMLSGTQIENNIFRKVPAAMSIGGGRYSTIKNNLILDKASNGDGTTGIDQRGTTGFTSEYFREGDLNSPMLKDLVSLPYNEGIWAEKYPWLSNILEDDPGIPKHNVVQYNVSANAGRIRVTELNEQYGTFADNYQIGPVAYEITEDRKIKILEPEKLDECKGFNLSALELDKIGVYGDGNYTIPKAEYEKTTGVEDKESAAPDESVVSQNVEIVDIGDAIISDTKNWDVSAGSISVNGNEAVIGSGKIGYKAINSENVLARCTFKLGDTAEWVGIEIRSNSTSEMPWTGKKSYLFIMKEQNLELQRWNGGSTMMDIRDNYYLKSRADWTNLELRAYTDENGKCWLKSYINGVDVFSMEDRSEMLRISEPGTVNFIVSGGDITIAPYDPQYNTATAVVDDVNKTDIKNEETEPQVYEKPINVFFNGKELTMQGKPYLKNNRTMVPFRSIFESLEAAVDYDELTQRVYATKGSKRILIDISSGASYINGEVLFSDAPAELKDDYTMVPIRLISEVLGARVTWDDDNYSVNIYSEGYTEEPSADTEPDTDEKPAEKELYSETRNFDQSKLIHHNVSAIDSDSNIKSGELDTKKIDELIDFNKKEEPYYTRAGLPNFRYKLEETKEKLNVVFIGGSITQGDGYRNKICDWLVQSFGDRFNFVNAGIGGTGSGLANTRYYYDVIKQNPDLVFVEFAVNDTNAKSSAVEMEAIVRQQWLIDPTVDMMFLYTVQESGLDTAMSGKYTPVAKAQDYVAEHYGIPSIFMGYDAARMVKDGELAWNGAKLDENNKDLPVFSVDGTHPNATGSEIYWNTSKPAFEKLLTEDTVFDEISDTPLDYLSSKNAFTVAHYDPSQFLNDSFEKLESKEYKSWNARTENVYSAKNIGDGITFDFDGTEAGIFVLSGGDCPAVDVIVDGKTVREGVNIFLPYHGVVEYGLTTVTTGELMAGKHTVTFKISQTKIDKYQRIKETTNNAAQLTLMQNNAEFYNSTNLIVGSVFVCGKITDN